MGDKDENRRSSASTSSGMGNLSRNPRDLLQRFMESEKNKSVFEGTAKEEEEEEMELNLGLSLGGRFGIDKSSKKLMRSSSIAGSIPVVRDDDAVAPPPVVYPALMRTSSLPVETEEEWRKRKELQTLRRMEAKRRRSEKQRNLKGEKDSGGSLAEERREIEPNFRGKIEREQPVGGYGPVVPTFGFSTWAVASRQAILRGGFDVGMLKGKGNYVAGSGSQGFSAGSMESKGGSSSNMSDLDSKPLQGGEASPVSIQTLQERNSQEAVVSSGTKARENTSRTSGAEMETPSKRTNIAGSPGREIGTNALEDMPCVFTMGDGPNGRRIEGILYKYGKGEEVRIMCVCHGSFLSPAEFVTHAGGSDVTHPLKHIVVNPNSFFL